MTAQTSISLQSLQAVTRKAHRICTASDKPRIERALVLLALDNVHRLGRTTFRVVSQTDPFVEYVVRPGTCTCADSQKRPTQTCKHRWSCNILVWAERIEAARAEADRFPLLSAAERSALEAVKARRMAVGA